MGTQAREAWHAFVALLACWALVFACVPAAGVAWAAQGDSEGAQTRYSGASDPVYLQDACDVVGASLDEALGDDYVVSDVHTAYVSQEYLEELAYNTQANVFFGYSLADLDAQFQGTRYVFGVEDGQTVARAFEPATDEFAQYAGEVASNVAVGAGVILACAVITPVTTVALAAVGASAPAVAFFFLPAVSVTQIAAGAAAFAGISGVVSGVAEGVRTGSVSEGVKVGVLTGSEDLRWGALLGEGTAALAGSLNVVAARRAARTVEIVTSGGATEAAVGAEKLTVQAVEQGIKSGRCTQKCIRQPNASKIVEGGMRYPDTDVRFTERYLLQSDGKTVIKGLFPKFEHAFELRLDPSQYMSRSYAKICNQKLAQAIESNPELASKFNARQLEMIKNGDSPDGYVWHHSEEEGVMQLVDAVTHEKAKHVGGSSLWGPDSAKKVGE